MRHALYTLVGLIVLALPTVAAAALININTADATLLDTLPGIGPSYAARIVTYRTEHGPFVRIDDIQNVSGIGPSTYAGIKDFITVGDTGSAAESAAVSTTSPPVAAPSGSAPTYVPPPSAITVHLQGSTEALQDVAAHFTARVTTKGDTADSAAHIAWSFGDGSSGEGSAVDKTYRYTGTYLVVVTATDGSATSRDELSVVVQRAQVHISAVSGDGVTLTNDADTRLDLSGWRLLADTGFFHIPLGTILLPHASVLFPDSITNLPASLEVMLAYPNGIVATQYQPVLPPEPAAADAAYMFLQPQGAVASSSARQGTMVESLTSTDTNTSAHEAEAVSAPAVATELATAGAALPPPEPVSSQTTGIFRSPWTLGLLGVIALAGGAFILL